MKKDTHKTIVQFRLEKEEPHTVYAFFPNEPEWTEERLKDLPDNGYKHFGRTKDELRQLFSCYAHIGQHSVCHTDYFMECEPATPKQYKDLAAELESIGYNLTIIS